MYTFFAILAAILTITAVLLCLKLRLIVEYCKNQGEKGSFSVAVTVFNGKITFNPTEILKKEKHNESSKSIKSSNQKNKNPEDESEKITDKLRNFKKTLAAVNEAYQNNKSFIKKRINVEQIEIYVKFGLFDAAQTGIATGIMWAVLYRMLAFFTTIGTVKNHRFEVIPMFNDFGFCSKAKGIFSFRLINIIGIALKLYFTYKRVCKKYEKA